ncbi:MAG: uroporphyrinogen decarboxylase [Spirochaetia bacterium]|nr:uroporphyrinogen decarboxylase [Spirochaetia bacterium]
MNSQNDTQGTAPILVEALRGKKTSRVPIWFMRQAGRYLPEYNEIRKGLTFLELCGDVDKAVEVSVQPWKRYNVDGIIMFADILTPLHGCGIPLYFEEKVGPILDTNVASGKEIELMNAFQPSQVEHVSKILGRLRAFADAQSGSATGRPGLLGFAGAPFTMASYLIEGRTSRKFEKTKAAIFGDASLFHRVSESVTNMTIKYLRLQLEAGADAVQIFDSWGGILAPEDFREFSGRYIKTIVEALKPFNKPIIVFVGNNAHLLEEIAALEPNVISLDWRITPEDAKRRIPSNIAIQGNMDPMVLYGNPEVVRAHATRALRGFASRPGYVFNLGHGIHPQARLDCVQEMINTVRNYRE